jgi:hypothetical protein
MTIFPEFEQQLVELAERASGTGPRRRRQSSARRIFRRLPGILAAASAVVVSVAIALVAVLFLRPAHHGPSVSTRASEASLLAQYSVLRRAQTPADRAEAGSPPSLNHGMSFGASGGQRGGGTLYYRVRITGLARYQNVPGLTRVVEVDGVSVALFVEHLTPSDTLPKATVTGNDPKGAARAVTRQRLLMRQRLANSRAGYSLWARVTRSGRAQLIAPGPSVSAGRGRFAPQVDALWGVSSASLTGPGGRIVAIEPDGVARVSWSWPREFDSHALSYDPKVTIAAGVHDNVAVAVAPARFASVEQIDPETVVRYAADGSVLARLTSPSNSAHVYLTSTWDGQVPGPETVLSRRAERDPATPNRVVLVPSVVTLKSVTLGPGPQLFFNVLLNHRNYFLRLTGGPRSGCIAGNPQDPSGPGYGEVLHPGAEPTVRGDTYLAGGPLGVIRCPGTYGFSVSVVGPHSQPYSPFGSATFTVR